MIENILFLFFLPKIGLSMNKLAEVLIQDDMLLDQASQLALKGGTNGDDECTPIEPPDPPMWPIDWP